MDLNTRLKEKLAAESDIKTNVVEAWGEHITVKTMSLPERAEFAELYTSLPKEKKFLQFALIIHSCIDGDGNKIWTIEDLDWLLERSETEITKLFLASNVLNKVLETDIEDAVKN